MKHKKSTKMTIAGIIAFSLIGSVVVSAHEMYPTAPMRWTHFSSDGMIYLKTNDDNLKAPYNDGNYLNGVAKWTASSSPVIVIDTSFSSSNVDIGTPTTTFWNSLGIPTNAAAVAINFDTNGIRMLTQSEAEAANGKVNYANLWFNPDANYAGSTELLQNKTMVHEMGHVMGLGHPTGFSGNSIMKQGVLTYDTPQQHEADDLRSFYKLSKNKMAEVKEVEQHSHENADHPENFEIIDPASFEETVGEAQLIVAGSVVDNPASYSIDDNIIKADPFISAVSEKMAEKQLGKLEIPKVIPTKVKITDTLKGDASVSEITIIQSEAFSGYDPKLNKGDNYVYFLRKTPQPNTYVAIHHQAGYYKIDEKNQIKALYKKEQAFSSIEELDLNKFKEKVSKIK